MSKHKRQTSYSVVFMFLFLVGNLLGLSACSQAPETAQVEQQSRQQGLTINTNEITVSGLSSGGYMATQFHLSHAEIVKGVGIIAAGPYNCARGSIATVFAECINKAPAKYAPELFSVFNNKLAAPQFLEKDKVWLLHGTLDERIHADVAKGLYQQYQQWVSADNLVFINDKPFSHVFPTDGLGGKCDVSESPFIGNCDYDAAGIMLNHIIGDLQPKVGEQSVLEMGELLSVDQSQLTDLTGTGMAEKGFVYLPNSCKAGKKCNIHVSFHGCNQSISNVDDAYAKNTGINQWAASNDLIVLYPQIQKSTMMPMNPQACWDWWGYTDTNYANKEGKQIQAVNNMIINITDHLNAVVTKQ